MRKIAPEMLSESYRVRRLTPDDVGMLFTFCRRNGQYYEYCGKDVSPGLIENDLRAVPPGVPMEQKYYVGFFDEEETVAIMDLIDGYPDDSSAFIGFFMVNRDMQGRGVGSRIVAETLRELKKWGIGRCQLGIDKFNPQSNHFWRRNGFSVIREVEMEGGTILVAEKQI